MLAGLTWLLVYQCIGEILVHWTGLPVPGPVVGMVLLFVTLVLRNGASESLQGSASGLLSHLSLLFVPAGVGVMQHFNRVASEWLPIAVALVVSTVLALAATALVMRWLLARQERYDEEREAA
ncbi:MAG: CidA/LrgA family protein [Casimicrobiaceae bacterium]